MTEQVYAPDDVTVVKDDAGCVVAYMIEQQERCPTCGCPDPHHLNHGRSTAQGPCPDPFHRVTEQERWTITDEACAAAIQAERSQDWHSDELRVWAMLAAASEHVESDSLSTAEDECCKYCEPIWKDLQNLLDGGSGDEGE